MEKGPASGDGAVHQLGLLRGIRCPFGENFPNGKIHHDWGID
jgi:hypothetical protein